jgi:hypothetical protein
MTASALFDLLKAALQAHAAMAGWKIYAHTAQLPADKQVDMTLGAAPLGAAFQGPDWMTETLLIRFTRAVAGWATLGEAHRALLDLRDTVGPVVLDALEVGDVLLYPNAQQPQWDEVTVTTASANDNTPYLVLELQVPLERRMS